MALGAGADTGTGGSGDDTMVGDSSAGIKALGFHGRDVFIGNRGNDLMIGDNEALAPGVCDRGGQRQRTPRKRATIAFQAFRLT